MAHIYRAFYAPMMRMSAPSGIPTKVPFLFNNILRRLLKDYRPDYIAIVFDPPGATFRDKLFEKYKAQRAPMPDEMRPQLPYVRRLCEALRLPVVELQGYEADDVIGALAKKASKDMEVLIVSNDKDMMQLVGKNVRILRTGSGGAKADVLVDEKKVEEILGVPPERVIDVMSLMGDTVDNIPGAKGIGEKGATELIQKYGTVEGALEHAAEVPNKRYREALQQQREQVMLSKQLATISADAPIKVDLQGLQRKSPDRAALAVLYRELGFTSLLRELGTEAAGSASAPETSASKSAKLTPFANTGAFRDWLGKLPAEQPVAVWLAVDAGEREVEGFGARVTAIEVSQKENEGGAVWADERGDALQALAPVLADPKRPKIVHDPKLLQLLNGPAENIIHATQLYSYLLRPTTANHHFADVVFRQFNTPVGGGPGEHAAMLHKLAAALRAQVDGKQLDRVYETIDLPLSRVLADMERVGVRVDPKALDAMSRTMEKEVRRLEQEIWQLAGQEFNVNSPAQLAEILFDKLNLQTGARRSKAKARSTAVDVLELLKAQHPLPGKIIEYREIAKLKSTYVDALPKLIHPETQRLHTSFSQTTAATGRLSSSDPNLQNIPIRTELGRQIRAAFVAEKGKVLLAADYSQIELRIMAHFSQDPVLVEAFRNGEDIHARTAQEVFGVGPLAQTADHRRAAKAINFGIIYGLSPFGLAQQLGIEQKEAAQFINAYFSRYRGVKEHLDQALAETRKTGEAKTLFGRIRPIPEITSPQIQLRNFAERTALNSPLQGTAADLIKLAMISIHKRLREETFGARMILQVHDELLFEVPREETNALEKMVREEMEGVHKLDVPLVVETCVGPNWRDMQ